MTHEEIVTAFRNRLGSDLSGFTVNNRYRSEAHGRGRHRRHHSYTDVEVCVDRRKTRARVEIKLIDVEKDSWARGEVIFSYFAYDMLEESRKRRHYIKAWQTNFSGGEDASFQLRLDRLLTACEAWLSLTTLPEVRNSSTMNFYDSFRKEHECWQMIVQRNIMTFTDVPFITGVTPVNWNCREFIRKVVGESKSYAKNFMIHTSVLGLVDLLKTNEVIWAQETTLEPWFLLNAACLIVKNDKEPDTFLSLIVYDGDNSFAIIGSDEKSQGRMFVQQNKFNVILNIADKVLLKEAIANWLSIKEQR